MLVLHRSAGIDAAVVNRKEFATQPANHAPCSLKVGLIQKLFLRSVLLRRQHELGPYSAELVEDKSMRAFYLVDVELWVVVDEGTCVWLCVLHAKWL